MTILIFGRLDGEITFFNNSTNSTNSTNQQFNQSTIQPINLLTYSTNQQFNKKRPAAQKRTTGTNKRIASNLQSLIISCLMHLYRRLQKHLLYLYCSHIHN